MLFNSLAFIFLFLPLSIILYYFLVRNRLILGAKLWLVASSLFFYSYWNIIYLPLILISMSFNFVLGATLSEWGLRKLEEEKRRALLLFGISANVLALAYFKYADFLIDNINAVANLEFKHLNIVLPLAISFFTFQQIAYLVDSYKGLTKEYDILTYMLFITFFPQLIAGPIVAHYEMMPQFTITKNLSVNYKNMFKGFVIFLIGLFKKIVIADTFAYYATLGFDKIDSITIIGGWFTSLSYTAQIYFDFSGYCDMAIGSALFFNIKLPVNFNSPYKALNIQDFWKRWHITLSRFLRDYIYIPLGGNRKGEFKSYFNVFVVFLIGGLWHGAAWTFVIWGCLHGVANIIYRLWKKCNIHMNKIFAWFLTFNFINMTWIFFRANSFDDAKKVLFAMFDISSMQNLPAFKSRYYLQGFGCHSNMIFCLLIIIVLCTILPNSVKIIEKIKVYTKKQSTIWGICLGLFFLALIGKLIIIPYSEFIYFNF